MEILNIYKKYKNIRLENKISVNALSKKSGLVKKTIYNIENGEDIKISTLSAYVGAIDLIINRS